MTQKSRYCSELATTFSNSKVGLFPCCEITSTPKLERGAIALPMTAGSIIVAYDLPGVPTGLQLPRKVYILPIPKAAARTPTAVELVQSLIGIHTLHSPLP